MTTSVEQQARDALTLVDADPRRALKLATALQVPTSDAVVHSIAARVQGLALFQLDDVEAALGAAREAVRWGHRAGSPTVEAEARMSLAYLLSWRGRSAEAVRVIGRAVDVLDGLELARALALRGVVRHQQGRIAVAVPDYSAAIAVLREADDPVWLGKVLMNRGNAHAHLLSFGAADADLQEARELFEKSDAALSQGHVDHNLGYLEVLRGDIPAALEYFDRAGARFVELGAQLGPLLRDRAELLLSARLIAEASEVAERAVAACLTEGRGAILPEARLILARTRQLQGNLDGALGQARSAARELDRQGQRQLAALARLIVITLRLVGTGRAPDTGHLEQTIAAASGLWPHVALEARIQAGEAALTRRRPADAERFLRAAARSRTNGTATVRARAWYATAVLHRAHDDDAGARRAVRRGLRILDDYAAVLGATDIRAHVATHRNELSVLGARIAIEHGSARDVLAWAELGRASHLARPPGRPPDDPELAERLVELRSVIREVEDRRAQGEASPTLLARQANLERVVRDRYRRRRVAGGKSAALITVSGLRAALGDVALIEYVALDDTLYAVTLVDGRTRLHVLGAVSRVTSLAERLPFALHRLARRRARPAELTAARRLLEAAARELDQLMICPLTELGDRSLVIVPTGRLQWLPWSTLPSCAGRPVTVSPSATLWHAARSRAPGTDRIVVAAGPDLPAAVEEARDVARWHDATALTDGAATVGRVLQAMDGAALVHLAAHGRVRADNPQFDAIRLSDGPLMIYDLERLPRAAHTVVVAACDSGRPVVPSGDELLGLTATLLAQGSAQLVASVLPILDVETRPLMNALHERLGRGEAPAAALAAAQVETAATGPAGIATAAGFLCFGAGFAPPLLRDRAS